ncbi:MAG: hypothetical protein KAQ99_09160, partial [Candidatus Aureabacteria bacterium]|nr:hypothetical protein [Candidatus Auribacterota bacterium]
MQKTKSIISVFILSFISLILNSSAVLAVDVDMEAGTTATYTLTVKNIGIVPMTDIGGEASIVSLGQHGKFSIKKGKFSISSISEGNEAIVKFQVTAPPQPDPENPIIMKGEATFTITKVKDQDGKKAPFICTDGKDTISADPTFIQRTRKAIITAGGGSPINSYNKYYNYPLPQEISVNPSLPNDISIYYMYRFTSFDMEAQITISEGSLSEDTVIAINNTDKSNIEIQLVKAQYDTELSAYNQGIKSEVNTSINIDTQSYINEAVTRGMDEQTVTDYINNTISTAQNNLNTAIDNLINTTHNTLLPALEPVNVQISSKVGAVINDVIVKENQFIRDREDAIQKAQVENNIDDLAAQLEANGASEEIINQIQEEAEEKAESQSAIAISLLEASKFNDIKTLHDDGNLFIQNLIFDTNKTVTSKNNTLRQQILDGKDNSQSNAEKDIITYIRGITDTVLSIAQISFPVEAQSISDAVNFSGTASDENIKEYTLSYFDGANWNIVNNSITSVTNSALGIWNTNTVANGNYPVRLRVVDTAGNVSKATINVTVNNQDLTVPVITIASPASGEESAGVITINGSITENYLSSYIVEYFTEEEPENWIQIGSTHKVIDSSGILASFSPLLLSKGNHTLRITATDTSNNSSNQTITVNTGHKFNNTGGQLYAANTLADDRRLEFAYKSFDFKPNNLMLNQPAVIKLHYTDEELSDRGYEENLLNIFLYDEETFTWEVISTQIDFENNVLTANINKLGVYAIKEDKPDLVDVVLPSAEITNSAYNSSTGMIDITGTANDENLESYVVEYGEGDIPYYWIRVENSPKIIINSVLAAFEAKNLLPGSYSVRLTVYDQAENSSQAVSSFIVGEDKIINLYTSSDYIAPEVTSEDVPKEVTITYQILQDTYSTVKIKDGDANVITLLDNQFQTTGIQQVVWDGKDVNNQFVSAKTYTIEISTSAGTQLTTPIEVKDLIAKISVPYENSLVRGSVPVFGLACGKDFKEYTVEYGEGDNPAVWTPILTAQYPQNVDAEYADLASGDETIYGNLATWDTGLANYTYGDWLLDLNGTYTLRLTTTNNADKQEVSIVTVMVARVITNIYGGTAISPDGKIILTIPEQAIQDDFELISILPADNQTVSIDSSYQLVGSIYEIRPPGEIFTKDVTLEMSYTETELGSLDETKLAVYAYNPTTLNWDYLTTNQDLANNRLNTVLREITWPYAYYAILAKISTPDKPVLYNLSNANNIQLQCVTIFGMAGKGETIEIFVNGQSKGTTQADKDTGYFSLSNVLLDTGTNVVTAVSTDQFGQTSSSSDNITITQSETPPLSVVLVSFKDSTYSADYTEPVYLKDTLYIEVVGVDADANTQDATSLTLTSSITDSTGIIIQLLETDYNSGIYRGFAYIDSVSNTANREIAAQSNGEIITVTSLVDNAKFDTLTVVDNVPPQVPAITSSTHPSICQSTFESGFDEWVNRDGEIGAALYLNDTQRADSTNCLELVNAEYGGNFASNVITTPFDAEEYPIISFDYKIKEDTKINFLVKLENDDIWYDIVFTDTAKNYWRINMEQIGTIEGVVKDDTWQNISFNLPEMLKTKTDNFQVEEIIMADWDTAGYMKLVYGTNPAGSAYYIDNFMINKRGFADRNPQFTILAPADSSGIAGYSFVLGQIPNTIPDMVVDSTTNVVNFTDVDDGLWYFHARVQDGSDNWSKTNHYKIFIDTNGPYADTPAPAAYASSGDPTISIHLTDNQGSGVDTQTVRLKVGGSEYDINNPALSFNKETEILTFDPSAIGIVWPDQHLINVELMQANDYLGNIFQNLLSWEWTLDYSLDTISPEAPEIISPTGHNLTFNKVTFMWKAEDANSIADYSFILDQNPETIPDDEGTGLITSKIYDLAIGTYYFHVRAKDRPGNWSETTHYEITISENSSLLINDFDDGSDPNEAGGSSGTWNSNGAVCQAFYYNTDLNNVYSGSGYSLQLNYDVTPVDTCAGYWTDICIDLSDYKTLSFWVKGTVGGEKLRVGLKDSSWNETKVLIDDYLSSGVTTSWQKVVIPLSAFGNIADWTSVDNISISFDNYLGIPASGTVYIDEFRFEQIVETIIVNTFNVANGYNTLGGSFETFTGGAAAISASYDSDNTYNNSAYGYNIIYSGITSGGDYAVWQTKLNNLDTSNCNTLSFYVKGSLGGEKPNIYLGYSKDDSYNRKHIDIERYLTITTEWQKVNIPLLDFITQGVDITNLIELQVVFEWDDMSGTIYLEDIQFSNAAYAEVPIVDTIPDITNQENIIITGRGTPGQTIIPVVEVPYSGCWEQTPVIVEEDGTFSTLVNIGGEGLRRIYVYAVDENGSLTLNSAIQSIFLDRSVPPVPTINEITSPTLNPDITVSGLAESNTTVHIKITQPNSGLVEYNTQAANGAYSMAVTLSDGDGNYQIITTSKDAAGNLSSESTPVEVILDAINESPLIVISQPQGSEQIGSDTYEILWQAVDPDPDDTLTIDIQYTNALNQILVDNFNDADYFNSLDAWSES